MLKRIINIDTLLQDLRFGTRMFVKKPLFTFVAVLTLALGIGANTLIFSGVYAILFRSLPYKNAENLNIVWSYNKQTGREYAVSYKDFEDLRDQCRACDKMSAVRNWSVNLLDGDLTERVEGALV